MSQPKLEIKGYDQDQITYFINGFVQALLFYCQDDHEEFLDSRYTGGDIEAKSFEKIKDDCLAFMRQADYWMDGADLEQCGMDFFYGRCGSGVGFRDRDFHWADACRLKELAERFSPLDVWAVEGEIFCE